MFPVIQTIERRIEKKGLRLIIQNFEDTEEKRAVLREKLAPVYQAQAKIDQALQPMYKEYMDAYPAFIRQMAIEQGADPTADGFEENLEKHIQDHFILRIIFCWSRTN